MRLFKILFLTAATIGSLQSCCYSGCDDEAVDIDFQDYSFSAYEPIIMEREELEMRVTSAVARPVGVSGKFMSLAICYL